MIVRAKSAICKHCKHYKTHDKARDKVCYIKFFDGLYLHRKSRKVYTVSYRLRGDEFKDLGMVVPKKCPYILEQTI